MKKSVIIVAGGSGTRMKTDLPKQFLALDGRPLLMHTLEAFHSSGLDLAIILILPADHVITWEKLAQLHEFQIPHQVFKGGKTRFDSVQCGLNQIDDNGIVAIHDGARPLVSSDVIQRTFAEASKNGNGIAAVPMKDSIRQVINGQSKTVNRNDYYTVQTPQTFQVSILKMAFAKSKGNNYSDDASVIESIGEKVMLVEGSYDNLKITTPEDLAIATLILEKRK